MAEATTCVFAPNKVPDGYVARRRRSRWCCRPGAFRPMPPMSPGLYRYALAAAPRYREIKAPTVVISGDRDTVVYEEIHSVGLARDIPGAELVWVQNLGHKPDWIAPDLVVGAIEKVAGKNVDLQALARTVEARIAGDGYGAGKCARHQSARSRTRADLMAGLWPMRQARRRSTEELAPLLTRRRRCLRDRLRRLAVGADIGDAQHVGGAGRPQRHAGGDDDAVARLAEAFLDRRCGRRGRPCRRGRWRRGRRRNACPRAATGGAPCRGSATAR